MTDAPLAASAAASGSAASAARQSTPGQRGRPVPGHRPDGDTQPGQVRGQGIADLAGPEHDMKAILTHDRLLAGLRLLRHRGVPPLYAGPFGQLGSGGLRR